HRDTEPEIDSHLSLLIIFSRLSGAYHVSVKTGGSTTIPIPYHQEYKTLVKYCCKGYYLHSCSPVVLTDTPKSTYKASISDDINQLTITVTMTDLEPEDSGRYRCAVEINGGSNVSTGLFHLSVTPGLAGLAVSPVCGRFLEHQ
uniref:Immunoglobulin domain-containing protein n=1 Tax=Hucho hucho TaxID=62062 RepID=A0A4W5NPL1_9TELE